jgi:hypothetical protein
MARKAAEDLIGWNGLGTISNNKLYAQLENLGVIASKDSSGKTTPLKSFNGQKSPCFALKIIGF